MKGNFINFITKLVKHELITGSFYIFVGSIIANFFAFILNLFLARNLLYADYGIFASLLSIIILASIPTASISATIVRFSSNYYSKNQLDELKSFYKKIAKFIFIFSIFLALLITISSPFIKDFLHLDSIWYVIVAGACVVISYFQVLNIAFLQGLMKFGFTSFVSVASAMVKLIAGVIFVFLGLKAFSGLLALLFMGLGGFLISFIPLKFIFSKTERNVNIHGGEILRYALPAFIIVLFTTSFTSMDIILAKHFFNARNAGLYAGLSLIGRVIFYFTAPIPSVMFPLLIKRHNLGKNFNNLFYLALLLVLLPSLLITVFYFLFPGFVIKFFLAGRDYMEIVQYVGMFGIYLTIFSLINVCVNFFLSLNKIKIMPLIILASLAQIILITFFHDSFYQVITISIIVLSILLLSLLAYYFKAFFNYKKKDLELPIVVPPVV